MNKLSTSYEQVVDNSGEEPSRAVRHTHTGIINNSNHTPYQARAREDSSRRRFTQAEIDNWRKQVFGDTLNDPVKVVVEDAVRAFGRAKDFRIWAWFANRMGVNSFLELYFEQESIMRQCRLRNPAERAAGNDAIRAAIKAAKGLRKGK